MPEQLQDKNIYFDENFVSDELIKDITAKVFHAKLTYSPTYCLMYNSIIISSIIITGLISDSGEE